MSTTPVPPAAPPALAPRVTLEHTHPLRQRYVLALDILADLFAVALDATSGAPKMPLEAQRLDVERFHAELRRILLDGAVEVDVVSDLIRLAGEQRDEPAPDPSPPEPLPQPVRPARRCRESIQ